MEFTEFPQGRQNVGWREEEQSAVHGANKVETPKVSASQEVGAARKASAQYCKWPKGRQQNLGDRKQVTSEYSAMMATP